MKNRQSKKVPTRRSAAAALAMAFMFAYPIQGRPQTPAPLALVGHVGSEAEGPMEGVLVSASRVGSTMTVTVVSDREGRYAFPASRLEPGRYRLAIRAVGYEMDDPGEVQVTARSTQADLELRKTRDLASQLTSAEWLLSVPGTPQQKAGLFRCSACHQLTPVVNSRHSASEWLPTLIRMMNWQGPSVMSHK